MIPQQVPHDPLAPSTRTVTFQQVSCDFPQAPQLVLSQFVTSFHFCVNICTFNEGEYFIKQLSKLHENQKRFFPPPQVQDTNSNSEGAEQWVKNKSMYFA